MKLDIKNKMNELNLTKYALAKKIDVTYPTMTNLYEGKSTSIKFEILEALCRELNCTPNDILVYEQTTSENEIKERTKKILQENGLSFGSKMSEESLKALIEKLNEYVHSVKK